MHSNYSSIKKLPRTNLKVKYEIYYYIKAPLRDFPGGPVVKTSPSNIGGAGLIPGREAKIPHALQLRGQNKTETVL